MNVRVLQVSRTFALPELQEKNSSRGCPVLCLSEGRLPNDVLHPARIERRFKKILDPQPMSLRVLPFKLPEDRIDRFERMEGD